MRKTVRDEFCGSVVERSSFAIVCTAFAMAIGILVVFVFLSSQSADANPVHHQTTPSASCVSGEYTDDTDDDVPKMRTDPEGTTECKVKLRNGRTITCIDLGSGTSCDWDHATTKKGK